MVKRVDTLLDAILIDVFQHFDTELFRDVVAELDHLAELPRGVHVQERERRLFGVKGLQGQMQHDGAVLADRIKHHRFFAFGCDFADDVDSFGFQLVEV